MPLEVRDPELFAVTSDSLTLSFDVADASGSVAAPARVFLNGELRAVSEDRAGTRLVRIERLAPGTDHEIEIRVDGAAPVEPGKYFPGAARTLAAPRGRPVARFATLNDLHFGEERFGGTLRPDGEYGEPAPGFPQVRETDGDAPYWRVMNEDAIADINALGVDATIVKGDIADRGRRDQFEVAARTFAGFARPWHAFLGNHDHYARLEGDEVDGYALLGQPAAPRALELGGWKLLLLDTVEPGQHHGVFPDARLRWLAEQLEATRETQQPTLLLTHHQPVPPEHRHSYPNSIGIIPEHSVRMFELLGKNPQVRAVLIGHTHRNRVRRYEASGAIPFVEVHCVKDYPGGFAVYDLFDDGTFRQEVRRTSSRRALAHSTRCRDFFRGGYRDFALGTLGERAFAAGTPR
ncbi:MAG TPA: metallophosphoesterase [Myxococcota bacterium]|nr:metallophosphoesterase [Myxococcota bacterium]